MNILNLPYEQADEILHSLTLEQKIGQMVIASVEVTEMDERTRRFLSDYSVGNIILFGKNCKDRAQLAQLNSDIQEIITGATGLQALISIDQEGGRVTRIRQGATVFPSAMAIGATGDPHNAYLTGYMMGLEMKALGIYHDFAPVLDCNFAENGSGVSNRSYSFEPNEVYDYAGAMASGLRAAGILDCGKHFPGQGHGHGDTHFDFVVHPDTREEINEHLIPFISAFQDGMLTIMTSHSCYPALEPQNIPNTVSSKVLQDFARGQLGFQGLIISDDVLMAAVEKRYGAGNAAVLSAQAGCDMVIIGNGGDNADPDGLDVQPPIIERMVEAARSGELSMERIDEAVRRIIAFKLALGDMRPHADVQAENWDAHAAFSRALAKAASKVAKDDQHLLPLPEGALFMAQRSHARLGVEEGDILFDSFSCLAADRLHGKAIEFDETPDLEALAEEIAAAPAVVFSVSNEKECLQVLDSMRRVYELNPHFCFVCLSVPQLLPLVPFAPCALYCYDQSLPCAFAACALLKGE